MHVRTDIGAESVHTYMHRHPFMSVYVHVGGQYAHEVYTHTRVICVGTYGDRDRN